MRVSIRILVALLALFPVAKSAHGQFDSSYWTRMPGARLFMEASRAYDAERYRTAYGKFHYAALWADKRAQYNLGVMNVSGQVDDFPSDTGLPCVGLGEPMACGWAWLELSAEREYPQFRRLADAVWQHLSERERELAREIHQQKLLPAYGDDERLGPTQLRMTRNWMRNGVSRVGYHPYDLTGERSAWELDNIIAYETQVYEALNRARVGLGEFRLIDNPSTESVSGDNDQIQPKKNIP